MNLKTLNMISTVKQRLSREALRFILLVYRW